MKTLGRLLSLDVGEKVIGCAISDIYWISITPLPPIFRKESSLRIGALKRLVKTYQPFIIVIGYPLLLDSRSSSQTKKIKAYANKIKKHFKETKIELFNEALSTWSVKKQYAHLNLKKNSSSFNIDSFSAMEIIKDYIKVNHF